MAVQFLKNTTVTFNKYTLRILEVVEEVYRELGYTDAVVTSGNDRTHGADSFHYQNRALDFRTRGMTREHVAILPGKVKERLGEGYDVLFEGDHLHVEADRV